MILFLQRMQMNTTCYYYSIEHNNNNNYYNRQKNHTIIILYTSSCIEYSKIINNSYKPKHKTVIITLTKSTSQLSILGRGIVCSGTTHNNYSQRKTTIITVIMITQPKLLSFSTTYIHVTSSSTPYYYCSLNLLDPICCKSHIF